MRRTFLPLGNLHPPRVTSTLRALRSQRLFNWDWALHTVGRYQPERTCLRPRFGGVVAI